ncbi:MAG: hypothetical protein AAFQ82_22490, partial [Myxococcota bacterium]
MLGSMLSREQGKAFPGGFDAFTEDGTLGILGSYGPTEFHLTDASGNRLNIDPSMPALIEMPLSIEGPNVGDEIPVWSLDETFGVWVSEGVGEVVASADSPTGRALRASVTHFSWWNPDVMLGEQRLIELVVDGAGNAGEPTGPGGDEGQPVQVRARSNGAFEAFFDSANAELLTGFDTTIANGVPATVSVAPGSLDVEAWSLDGRFRYDGPITIREVDQDRETLNLFDVWEEAQPFVHLLERDVDTTINFTPDFTTHYVRYECTEGEFIKLEVDGQGPGALALLEDVEITSLRPWRNDIDAAAIQRCPSTGKHTAYVRLYASTGTGQATVRCSFPSVQDELPVGAVTTLNAGPSSIHERLVYMRRNTTVFVAVTIDGGFVPGVTLRLERDEIDTRTIDTRYGSNTGVFTSARAGWHLLQVTMPFNHPVGQDVRVHVSELRQPAVVDFDAGGLDEIERTLLAGEIRRYIFSLDADDGFAAIVAGTSEERPRLRVTPPGSNISYFVVNPFDAELDR